MTIDETELCYQEQLIKEGIDFKDAQEAAHILRHVDGKRARTEEEQAFISSVWKQVVGIAPRILTRH